jgi:hypothetical protein
MGAQQRLGKFIEAATKETVETELQSDIISVPNTLKKGKEYPAASNVEPETGNVFAKEDDKRDYKGRLEIDIVPPIDFSQLISLEKLLLKVPNLRLIGRGGSDDGRSWAEIECSEPIPIVTILKQMSPVKEVATHRNHIIIALKAKQAV